MAFSLDSAQEGDVHILILHGYLDIEAGKALRLKTESLIGQGTRKFVFDLADAPLVSSAALGDLIDVVSKTLSMPELKICFCSLSNTVQACFQSVGFTLYAQILPNRAEALTFLKG